MKSCRLELARRRLATGIVALGLFGLPGARAVVTQPHNSPVTASALIQPGDPVYGNRHGTITIVDFYDIRCPPCRAMNGRIQKLLRTDHFLRYVPVAYPILGPASVLGTKALFAAAMQAEDKYRALRAILMRQKQKPDVAVLHQDANRVSLDWQRLELDMNGDRVAARIDRNLRRGRALGIHEIPTLFIGSRRIVGGLTYRDLGAVVAAAHASASRRESILTH